MIMIRTIRLKLNISSDTAESILKTMRDYTVAFNTCTAWGFDNHTSSKVTNHNATYRCVRGIVPALPSALVQGARDCACEAIQAVKCKTIPLRKPYSSMRYNQRVIHVYLESGYATIATSDGRVKVTFQFPDYYRKYQGWKIKSSTLSLRRNDHTFYLHCQVESRTPELVKQMGILGIDRGIINIAVCSDNTFYNSKLVKNTRAHYAYLRQQLQSKGTRSAKRKLRKLSGRERRFVTDVNHCIAKQIVQSPSTVFALEDLSKIRVQNRRGKSLNRKLNSWSFYQLEQFIRYKAEGLGKTAILVDARFTSQKCSACGHVYKGNRNKSQFLCRACGFELHADLNAARNIAHAGIAGVGGLPVNQPIVACP